MAEAISKIAEEHKQKEREAAERLQDLEAKQAEFEKQQTELRMQEVCGVCV
jgi:hypothetical protein